jgi:DNA-binding XRE family transcriptional regulator
MPERVVMRNGKRFVLVEERELRRLKRLAAKAEAGNARGTKGGAARARAATKVAKRALANDDVLPAYPPADAQGNRPAVQFARVSIARKIIQDRKAAGLTQQELARRAGVRQETISRLESGKHSPTVRTVEKIDRVLQAALRKA